MRPSTPSFARRGDGRGDVHRLGDRIVGTMPGERERDAVAASHFEAGDGMEVLTVVVDRQVDPECVGARDGSDPPSVSSDPRNDRAVVEADREIHLHRDPAVDPLDESKHARWPVAELHAVREPNDPVRGLEGGRHDEVAVAVGTVRPMDPPGRSDLPASVVRGPEQRCEARSRVEPRNAQPVDRSVATDERCPSLIPEEPVVLDPERHARTLPEIPPLPVPSMGTLSV